MAKAKKAPEPKSEVEILDNFDQQSDDWRRARCGLLTASNFGIIMRSGKDGSESATRRDLLYTLAGEILCGEPAESYQSAEMRRGIEMETEARDYYERTNFCELRRVGFIRRKLENGIVVGASPDSLVNNNGALEIKTVRPDLLIAQMLSGGGPPPRHRAQLHGIMWVAKLEWIDLLLFYRGMPVAPKFRVGRDDVFIREISDAVETFDYELKRIVEKIRAMGGRA